MADHQRHDGELLYHESDDDVFHIVVEDVVHQPAHHQQPAKECYVALVLLKHKDNGQLYIAASVTKASLKHQGNTDGHSSWQSINSWDGTLKICRGNEDVASKDNAILSSVLKVAAEYYDRASGRHMSMAPLGKFLTWFGKRKHVLVGMVLAALGSSHEFASWLQREPAIDRALYIPPPPPAPQEPAPQPQPHAPPPPPSPAAESLPDSAPASPLHSPATTIQAGSSPSRFSSGESSEDDPTCESSGSGGQEEGGQEDGGQEDGGQQEGGQQEGGQQQSPTASEAEVSGGYACATHASTL